MSENSATNYLLFLPLFHSMFLSLLGQLFGREGRKRGRMVFVLKLCGDFLWDFAGLLISDVLSGSCSWIF
jgi:hypothetical protein